MLEKKEKANPSSTSKNEGEERGEKEKKVAGHAHKMGYEQIRLRKMVYKVKKRELTGSFCLLFLFRLCVSLFSFFSKKNDLYLLLVKDIFCDGQVHSLLHSKLFHQFHNTFVRVGHAPGSSEVFK